MIFCLLICQMCEKGTFSQIRSHILQANVTTDISIRVRIGFSFGFLVDRSRLNKKVGGKLVAILSTLTYTGGPEHKLCFFHSVTV